MVSVISEVNGFLLVSLQRVSLFWLMVILMVFSLALGV